MVVGRRGRYRVVVGRSGGKEWWLKERSSGKNGGWKEWW